MRPPTAEVSRVRSEMASARLRPSSLDQKPKLRALANPAEPAFASSLPMWSNCAIAETNSGDFMFSQPLAKFEYAAGSVIAGCAAFTAWQILVQIDSANGVASTLMWPEADSWATRPLKVGKYGWSSGFSIEPPTTAGSRATLAHAHVILSGLPRLCCAEISALFADSSPALALAASSVTFCASALACCAAAAAIGLIEGAPLAVLLISLTLEASGVGVLATIGRPDVSSM